MEAPMWLLRLYEDPRCRARPTTARVLVSSLNFTCLFDLLTRLVPGTYNSSSQLSWVEFILRPTVSRPVPPGIGLPFGAHDQILSFPFFSYNCFNVFPVGRPLWREDGSVVSTGLLNFYLYIFIDTYLYIFIDTYLYIFIDTYLYIFIDTYLYIFIDTYLYIFIRIYRHIFIHIYRHIFIHIYRHM
jgi:hypothetical protein